MTDRYDEVFEEEEEDEEVDEDWLNTENDVYICPEIETIDHELVPVNSFLLSRIDIHKALLEVEELQFKLLPEVAQAEMIKSLVEVTFTAGENVIVEGEDDSLDFYFILDATEGAHVEVVKLIDGVEKTLTSLCYGQYFGEKFFITGKRAPRNATIRVIASCPGVLLGKVSPEFFPLWVHFYDFLLMKEVPFIRSLPRAEQFEMYGKLEHREYAPRQIIVRQGDIGDDFYIIQEGSVSVVDEDLGVSEFEGTLIGDGLLVTLYEGHCFGEMALLTDDPRVASVYAATHTACLCLSKSVFQGALSAITFNEIVTDMMNQRKELRERRKSMRHPASANSSMTSMTSFYDKSFSNFFADINSMDGEQFDGGVENAEALKLKAKEDPLKEKRSAIEFSNRLDLKKGANKERRINQYKIIREIGEGSFGCVYHCVEDGTNESFAVKMVNRSTHWGRKLDIMTEIEVMKYLDHPNLVKLKAVIDDPSCRKVFIVLEFMAGGMLMEEQEYSTPFSEDKAHKYFCDAFKGLHYLHSRGILHGDIKPQNMLLTGDHDLKIADFGTSIFMNSSRTNSKLAVAGTPAFMAPELFADNPSPAVQKSTAVDVFALGATLYCMMVGKPPWMAKNQIDLAARIQKFELVYPVNIKLNPHLKHLLSRMMAKDVTDRIDMEGISVHDWVTKEGSTMVYSKYDRSPAPCALSSPASRFGNSLSNSMTSNSSYSNSTTYFGQLPEKHMEITNRPSAISIPPESGDNKYNNDSNNNSVKSNSGDKKSGKGKIKMRKSFYNWIMGKKKEESDGNVVLEAEAEAVAAHLSPSARAYNRSKGHAVMDMVGLENIGPSPPLLTPARLLTKERHIPDSVAVSDDNDYGTATLSSVTSSSKSSRTSSGKFSSLTTSGKFSSLTSSGVISGDSKPGLGLLRTTTFEIVPTEVVMSTAGKLSKGLMIDKSKPTGGVPRDRSSSLSSSKATTSDRSASEFFQGNICNDSDFASEELMPRTQGMIWQALDREISSLHGSPHASRLSSPVIESNGSPVYKGTDNIEEAETKSSILSTCSSEEIVDYLDWISVASDPGESLEDSVHLLAPISPISRNVVDVIILEEDEAEAQEYPRKQTCIAPISSNVSESSEQEDDDDDYDSEELIVNMDDMGLDEVFKDTDRRGRLSMVNDVSVTPLDVESEENAEIRLRTISALDANSNLLLGIRSGASLSHGAQSYMEDHVTVCCDLVKQQCDPSSNIGNAAISALKYEFLSGSTLAFFGVYDGHSGDYVANRLENEFHAILFSYLLKTTGEFTSRKEKEPLSRQMSPNFAASPSMDALTSCNLVEQCLIDTCATLDRVILDEDYSRQNEFLAAHNKTTSMSVNTVAENGLKIVRRKTSGSENFYNARFAGSCGVMVVLLNCDDMPSGTKKQCKKPVSLDRAIHAVICHVGDSRAVLSDHGVAVELTKDHKPEGETERNRIEKAGGHVHRNRVNGFLAVSRSFGDIMYKTYQGNANTELKLRPSEKEEREDCGGLWSSVQQVISKPDVKTVQICPSHEFIVIASDGLWDVVSNQECVNFVRRQLCKDACVTTAAAALLDKAIKRGSSDNISVVICCLNQQSVNGPPSC